MNDRKDRPSLTNIFSVGTPECAVFCGVLAMVLGLLLLTVGFWNTVWVALFGVVGGFLGGVKEKKQILKNVLNRVIPDKRAVPYREQHPDITRAVRDAASRDSAAMDAEKSQSGQE